MKNRIIRDFKLTKNLGKLVYPYVLTTTMVVGATAVAGEGYPFIKDTFKSDVYEKKETDSNGNILIIEEKNKLFFHRS